VRRLDDEDQALISIQGFTRGNDKINVINESGADWMRMKG
jgi:hypothetical protein